jgi:type III secretion protein R
VTSPVDAELSAGSASAASPFVLVAIVAVFALLPFALMLLTSFVKISVVLSIARSAIGAQQIPPSPVITGLALVLTAHVMTPVASEVRARCTPILEAARRAEEPPNPLELGAQLAAAGRPPIAAFLTTHARPRHRALFARLAHRARSARPDVPPTREDGLMVLAPAFLVSELGEAFEIGFVIFVPFLVIDMVVANVLLALGMQMLSPTTISLPFKLLLFVLIDGWHELAKSLVLGYLA